MVKSLRLEESIYEDIDQIMEQPRTVTIGKKRASKALDFNFSHKDIRLEGLTRGIKEFRENAWEEYKKISIPTIQAEAWRRTDLQKLNAGAFQLANLTSKELPQVPEKYLLPLVADAHGGQIIIEPGRASVDLDADLVKKGVIFTDLKTAELQYPDLLEKIIGKIVRPQDGKFAALAGAFAQDGVFLYIPKNVEVPQPLHSLMWSPGVNQAFVTHLLIYVEENASATYVHETASPTEENQSLHVGNVEIYVGAGGNLRFVELQSWGQNVWNFTHERVHVEQDGNIDWIFGSVGSRLTKNFSDLVLQGAGSTGKMSGFYFSEKDQHLDHDTQQYHLAPNTTSDMLFKGALIGNSRSVWQGMIYVAPGAFKADGYQANRNLILSPGARADSIPGLEILADDVRCTHGATVGKIDENEVFYLMSRGIPGKTAKRIITEGFFDPIMQRIPFEGVRERLFAEIIGKMDLEQEKI